MPVTIDKLLGDALLHTHDASDIIGLPASAVDSVNGKTGTVVLTASDVSAEPANANIQAHISSTSNPHSVTKTQVGLSNVDNVKQLPLSYLDTDGTLSANSDTKVASQKATKTYADQLIASANALVYKGVIDCSTNPDYPAGDAGFMYVVSVAGKIGGASGITVDTGDMALCNSDGTASGYQATVGNKWNIIEKNIVGAVSGPASATDGNMAFFDGTTGKLIKNGNPPPANTAAVANKFVTAYNSSTGAFTQAQPTWANIDKTTSNISDITTKSHTSLTDIGTNTHAQIDTALTRLANTSGTNTGDQIIPVNTTATANQFFTAYNSSTGAFTKAQPSHAGLTGLSNDDHTQYLLASSATSRTAFATNWTDLTDGGVSELHSHPLLDHLHSHPVLLGLDSDDHTQYILGAGRTGSQSITGGIDAGETLTLVSTKNATKGKILFGNSAYDEVNNRLGIGTTAPSYALDIASNSTRLYGSSTNTTQIIDLYSNTASQGSYIFARRARGTFASPLKVASGDTLGGFAMSGMSVDGSSMLTTGQGIIVGVATENWSGTTNRGTRIDFYVTPNGSGTQANKMTLDNSGYLGIGTTTPSKTLDVVGDIKLSQNIWLANAKTLRWADKDGTAGADAYFNLTTTNNLQAVTPNTTGSFQFIVNNATGVMQFLVNSNKFGISIASSGNVGIGTGAADKALEVNSATGACLRLTYNDADGSAANYSDLSVSSGGDLTIAPSGGDTTITGTLTVSTNLTVNGNITLGDASTDTITHTGRMIVRTTASNPQDATAANRPAGSVG